MNYYLKNGNYYFKCHECEQILEIGNLLKLGNNIICVICKAHLGYFHDLPDKVKNIIRRKYDS